MHIVLAALLVAPSTVPAPATTAFVAQEESAEVSLERGRALLLEGKLAEAQAAFDAAALAEPGPRTRAWVARGWIASWKIDEALEVIEEIKKDPAAEKLVDYLFGHAFLALAKREIATTGGGQYTQSQFEDALRHFKLASKTTASSWPDLWLGLAESAWYAQDLEAGHEAATRAIQLAPKLPQARVVAGRLLFSSYIAEVDEQAKARLWEKSHATFQEAIALYGKPAEYAQQSALADVHAQCGDLQGWKKDTAAAIQSYAAAIEWDPAVVKFPQVHSLLGAEAFLTCIEDGATRFTARAGDTDARNATTSWWKGFAQFENAKWPESEASFRRAVELWPAFTNSWYYVFRAAFSQQRYEEAIEALKNYRRIDPEGLTATLGGDFARNESVLNGLIGWCADPAKQKGRVRNDDAAMICEVFTKVQPEVARHWNNLGLFLRDQGDALRMRRGEKPDPEVLQDLWQRSFAAYERSIELSPKDPNYINDTAVMLHYYLKRDFERAQAMYEQSFKYAEEELARTDLSPDDRAVREIAKRDSADNQRRLKKWLELRETQPDLDPQSVR